MAEDPITIEELDPTNLASLLHEIPAMKDGLTVKLTIAQIQALMTVGANPAVALALKDLSNTVGPRGKFSVAMPDTTDYDTLLENGLWVVAAAAPNAPEATRAYVVRSECDNDAGYVTQLARGYTADSSTEGYVYKRERNAGAWGSWYRVRENEAELDARYIRSDPGDFVLTWRNTPPPLCLKANGAAVLIATYPTMAANIYCGNTDNPTADWGYKCTNPANPTGTRSTSGTYIVLPDGRGEFFRGWDDGRGADPGRNQWLRQLATQHPTVAADTGSFFLGAKNTIATETDGSVGTVTRSVVGGTDNLTITQYYRSRPRNLAPLVCIRYA